MKTNGLRIQKSWSCGSSGRGPAYKHKVLSPNPSTAKKKKKKFKSIAGWVGEPEFKASLGYTVRPCLKEKKKKTKNPSKSVGL
jgi:hypothetical protein